ILNCFDRHPEAAGVGGYITNDTCWYQDCKQTWFPLTTFRMGKWVRREDYRWRLRRLFGLNSPLAPGWMPPHGHGRPVSYLPPDGKDHEVEFIMGGASAWRRGLFRHIQFSLYF